MGGREFGEDPRPLVGEVNEDLAAVNFADRTVHEAAAFGTVNEFDGAVVLDLQTFGHFANGHTLAPRPRAECEQELVLLWINASGAGGRFAEVEKLADGVAELVEKFVIALRGAFGHSGIIPRARPASFGGRP